MTYESEATPGALRQLREMWEFKANELLGSGWNAAFADWIKKFGLALVTDAVQQASTSRYSEDDKRLPPDIRDVPKYATVAQAEAKEPGMGECYLVRGLMRKKFYCAQNDDDVLELLQRALRAGASPSAMYQAVKENNTLEDCFYSLGIERTEFRIAMGQLVVDLPFRQQVFIREEDPEWLIWNEYLRRTTGKGSPMNKNFGWFFPSPLPPTDQPTKTGTQK